MGDIAPFTSGTKSYNTLLEGYIIFPLTGFHLKGFF
jgi:hypothetical protein